MHLKNWLVSVLAFYFLPFLPIAVPVANAAVAPQAVTQTATGMGSRSAELNSLIINDNGDSTNAWFEWGTTPALGYKTVTVSLGSLSEAKHADILTGLAPNTLYYFRAVAENSVWRNIGATLSFVTAGGSIGSTSGIVTASSNSNTTIIIEPAPATSTESVTENSKKDDSGSALGANAIGGSYLLPQSLIGWLFWLVIFLVLFFLIRNVLRPKKEVKVEHSLEVK